MIASGPFDRRRGRRGGARATAPFPAAHCVAASATFSAVGARVVRFTMSHVHPSASEPGGLHVKTARAAA